jgi:hypothetical protein
LLTVNRYHLLLFSVVLFVYQCALKCVLLCPGLIVFCYVATYLNCWRTQIFVVLTMYGDVFVHLITNLLNENGNQLWTYCVQMKCRKFLKTVLLINLWAI